MEKFVFQQESCGSRLTIEVMADNDPVNIIQDCFAAVQKFEQKYSRFIPDNWLDAVNKSVQQRVALDDESFELLRFSLELAEKTGGAFDPTIISSLEAYGYDADYSFQAKESGPVGYKYVDLGDHTVMLNHGIKIEFGGVGKGYLLDVIAKKLVDAKLSHFIIDFGGDIFAKGGYDVGLENPFNLQEVIGTIRVDGFAVASSNGARRTVGEFHHLLDPHSGKPVRDIAGVYIAAATGLLADAYSTAVFVSGAEQGKKLLANTSEITGMIVFADGTYWKKSNYGAELFI